MLVIFFLIALLGLILWALFRALMLLLNPPKNPVAMVRALTWRITLSVLVFAVLMGGWQLGFWVPHTFGR